MRTPQFYSTCWLRMSAGGFLGVNVPPPPVPDWQAGDQCISCDFRNSVAGLNVTRAPNWADGLTDVCYDCDRV